MAVTPLAALLKVRIAASGRRQNDVAKQAKIHPSQLSQVLKGVKGLSRYRLLALASVLGISDAEVLGAAELDIGSNPIRVDLGSPHPGTAMVRVVTDPIFVDSAIFTWICNTQPLRKYGIELKVDRADWQSVPMKFVYGDTESVVGFYNRNLEKPEEGEPTSLLDEALEKVEYWSDLCVYHGYALLARPEILQNPKEFETRPVPEGTILELIEELRKGPGAYRKHVIPDYADNRIITMGADTKWRLVRSPAFGTALAQPGLAIAEIADADIALTSFLNGAGALFIGGLPQRLVAEARGCVRIITRDEDPFLFSVNSLVCTKAIKDKPILYWLDALWAQTIRQMREDSEFRQKVADECIGYLRSQNVTRFALTAEHFHRAFEKDFETFITNSSALTSEFVETLKAVFSNLTNGADHDLPRMQSLLDDRGKHAREIQRRIDKLLSSEASDEDIEEARKLMAVHAEIDDKIRQLLTEIVARIDRAMGALHQSFGTEVQTGRRTSGSAGAKKPSLGHTKTNAQRRAPKHRGA